MKKLFTLTLTVFFLLKIISFVQAITINIDTPPYVNLSAGSDGDGGLDLTENVSLYSGSSFGHGTISITLTNNNTIDIPIVQFIPNIISWSWTDGYNWYKDKLYYQSDTGNTVKYSNTINGKLFVTDFTYLGHQNIDYYDVSNNVPAFWTFPWTSYSAGVNQSNPNKFYGINLGGLSPNDAVTFYLQTYTEVDGTPFPNVSWGLPNQTATHFDLGWDELGTVNATAVPEPSTIILLGISAYACFLRKRTK